MNKPFRQTGHEEGDRPLLRMMRLERDRHADQKDAVEALRELCVARLEVLADDLNPVFAEVPLEDVRFDFVISSGLKPRLWLDATAHVTIAEDCRTYRFLLDTRLGRIVRAESDRTGPIIEEVSRYIAGRLIEREQMLAGETLPLSGRPGGPPYLPPDHARRGSQWGEYAAGVVLVVLGMIAGAGILAILLSDLWQGLF